MPYSHGMSYSSAKGVATAHATAVWRDGKEWKRSSLEPHSNVVWLNPVLGRARPMYLGPVDGANALAPASSAENPVRERFGSLPSIAASPATPIASQGMASPTLTPFVSHLASA